MKPKSYYDILQVSPKANSAEIKATYRRLALQHHPDKAPSSPVHTTPKSNKEFENISDAYSVLSNPDKRRIYDKYGQAGLSLHSQLGESNPKAVDFFLDTRKISVTSIIIALLLISMWVSIFLAVRKIYELNSISWGMLMLPIWIGFGLFIICGIGLSWYVNIRLDLSQLNTEPDGVKPVKQDDKWTAFFGVSLAILLFSLPALIELVMVTVILDFPEARWPLIPFIICEILGKVDLLWSKDKRPLQLLFAIFGPLLRILAFLWFAYFRSVHSLGFLFLDSFLLLLKTIILVSLKNAIKHMEITRHDLIKLVFLILFLQPIILPFFFRTVATASFSLHWCLVPVHISLPLLIILFGVGVPIFVHQGMSEGEEEDMESRSSSIGVIRQLIYFYAFAPRQPRILQSSINK